MGALLLSELEYSSTHNGCKMDLLKTPISFKGNLRPESVFSLLIVACKQPCLRMDVHAICLY